MKTEKKGLQLLLVLLGIVIPCTIIAVHLKWKQTGKLFTPETMVYIIIAFWVIMYPIWQILVKTNNKGLRLFYICSGITFCASLSIFIKWQETGKLITPETFLVFFVLAATGSIMLYIAIRMIKYFSNKSHQQLVKQIIPAIILFYVAWFVVSNSVIIIGDFFWFLFNGFSVSHFIPDIFNIEKAFVHPEIPKFLLIFTVIFFYILWRNSLSREQKLNEEKLKFQNETLKNQVNPHFLFNSLNTLSSLVNTQTEIAESFINKLSSIYRYILENSPKDKVSLKAELAFVNDFFYLHKIRDEDKIELDVNIKDAEKYEILPVSLQMLIENALKHNMATRESPLKIMIYNDGDYIVIKNNLQKMASQPVSAKTGLKNLSERVRLTTGKFLLVEETPNEYIVKIPLMQ